MDDILVSTTPSSGTSLHIGDANCSGRIDIADAICILTYLFGKPTEACKTPCCLANMDTNDSSSPSGVNIADAITVLSFLFARGTLTAPDAALMGPADVGCLLYAPADVFLACGQPCR